MLGEEFLGLEKSKQLEVCEDMSKPVVQAVRKAMKNEVLSAKYEAKLHQ
jgi:hypothetical protein